jgi:aspartate/methionine/tyrosine aminotransferase
MSSDDLRAVGDLLAGSDVWVVTDEIYRELYYVSTCASAVSQKAALAAFSPEGRRETALMREELGRRRDVMVHAIERELGLPYVAGAGAFYVMLDISQFGPSDQVAWSLLENKVITVPGGAFGRQGEGYLRLSFSIERAQIEEGIRRIATGLEKRGKPAEERP